MRHHYFTLAVAFLMILAAGCRSSQELVYLKNAYDEELLPTLTETETEYTVKPGDLLYVSIKSMNPEINALFNPEEGMQQGSNSTYHQRFITPAGAYLYGFEIDPAGNLDLPMLGSIAVAGLTHRELSPVVQEHADKFLKDATVKVKLLNYKVTVMGEVKSPGVYYNYNNDFTVLQAIAMANGNTDYARIKRVMVTRPERGGMRSYHLDLSAKESFVSPAFYLHPNDYVFVEPDKHKNVALNSTSISLLISSLSILLAAIGLIIR